MNHREICNHGRRAAWVLLSKGSTGAKAELALSAASFLSERRTPRCLPGLESHLLHLHTLYQQRLTVQKHFVPCLFLLICSSGVGKWSRELRGQCTAPRTLLRLLWQAQTTLRFPQCTFAFQEHPASTALLSPETQSTWHV